MTSAAGRRPRAGTVLLALSLLWFAWTLWSAQRNIHAAADPLSAIIQATDALPVVLSAAVVAGMASAVAALGWFPVRARLRWPLAIGVAALVGAVAATLILIGYGHRTPIVVLAVSVLVATVLGGALGAVPPPGLPTSGTAGTLATFLVGIVLHVFDGQLSHLFGASTSTGSLFAAETRVALTTSLLSGAVAGLIAFWLLRRAGTGRRFLVYLAGGALPGAVLLLTEVVTRVGGAQLFGLMRGLSEGNRTFVEYWGDSRLDHALVVFFVGAIVALLCFGRTLPAKPTPTRKPAAKPRTKVS